MDTLKFIVGFLSFLYILGTVGACENDCITISECMQRSLLVAMIAGLIIAAIKIAAIVTTNNNRRKRELYKASTAKSSLSVYHK